MCSSSSSSSSSSSIIVVVVVPEVVVKVAVFHELEDHHVLLALRADAVEGDDVVVLKAAQQLRLAVKVRLHRLAGLPF